MCIQKIPEISVARTGVQSDERNVLQGRILFPLTPSYNTPLPHPVYSRIQSSNDRERKQRRRRRQGERQKNNRFGLAKQQLCTCVTLFCTFLCRRCTTTTWKCLISRFVEDVNKRQRLSFFFWTSIHSFRIQLQKICRYLINWTSWNKRDKFWSSANSLFEWRFRNRRCRCCLRSISSWMDPWLLFSAVIHNTSAKR